VAANQKLIAAVRDGLRAAADPAKAPGMQAYMKSAMPYLGVMSRPLNAMLKEVFAAHPLTTEAAWRDTTLALWRNATHREERYAAQGLAGDTRYVAYQTPAAMAMYEEFIVDGAWWDHVDDVAVHRVGALLRDYPDQIEPIMRAWSTDDDMWRRRTSIICQVGAKHDIDLGLLYDCIDPNMADKQFFIRKAIGWALRSHAWLNPGEIARYVDENADWLSGLSKREALKNMGKLRK
jgi:3-methyladenine DNA glycosylase AlkD